MTFDDPRFSIVNHDNQSAVGGDGGAAPVAQAILVAQAAGEPVPLATDAGQQDGQGAAVEVPREVTADAQNVVRLPVGVSLDQFRVEGANLVLVQADGSEIVVLNGALRVPTFIIGEVEIPQDVLVAALGASGVDVAAGPEGLSASPAGSQSSGGEFQTLQQNDPPEDIGILNLLAGTDLGGDDGAGDDLRNDRGNTAPTSTGGSDLGTLLEATDNPGGTDSDPTPVGGVIEFFDIDFGGSWTASASTGAVSATNFNNGFTPSQAQLDTILAGFSLDSAATGGITTNPSAAGNGTVAWTYALPNAAVDFLAAGETLTLTFDVTISDGVSNVLRTVTITVVGTNDAPFFVAGGSQLSGAVTETDGATGSSAAIATSGTLAFVDVDTSDNAHQVTQIAVATSGATAQLTTGDLLGLFSASVTSTTATSDNGTVSWQFTAPDSTFDFLRAGQQLQLAYTVTLEDGKGGTTSQVVTVTVTGTNDAPVITGGDAIGAVTEGTGSAPVDTGVLTFADVDLMDTHSVSRLLLTTAWTGGATVPAATLAALADALAVNLGSDATGGASGRIDWTFTLADRHADFLAAGETLTVTYQVTVADDSGAANGTTTRDVTVVITGTNDVPVITGGDAIGAVTEGVVVKPPEGPSEGGSEGPGPLLVDTGALTFTDLDLTDTHSVSRLLLTTAWTGGETVPAATLAALADALAVNLGSDATGGASGRIDWTFTLADRHADFLAAGETLTVTYQVTVADDSGAANGTTTRDVTVVITGTNDVPVITGGDAIGAVTEGVVVKPPEGPSEGGSEGPGPLLVDTGALTFTDLDLTDTHSVSRLLLTTAWTGGATVPAATLAALADALAVNLGSDATGGASGRIDWTFTLADRHADFLAAGETLTVTYQVTVADDSGAANGTTTRDVTVMITGTNDVPVITGGDAIGAVTEGVVVKPPEGPSEGGSEGPGPLLVDTGALTFTDLDLTDTHSVSRLLLTTAWTGGATVPAATLAALADALAVNLGSDATGGASGRIDWTFTLADRHADFLAAGETLTVTYQVTVADDSGAANGTTTRDVTVVITGTNDVPVITGGDAIGAVTEGVVVKPPEGPSEGGSEGPGPLLVDTGALTFTDLDLTDTHSVSRLLLTTAWTGGDTVPAATLAALADALAVNLGSDATGGASGRIDWTFTLADRHADFLAAGETLTVTYQVTVADDSGAANGTTTRDVTVVITGTNDAPVLSSSSGDVTEFANTALSFTANTVTGQMSFTDVDLNDVGHSAVVVSAARSGETDGLSLVSANALRSMLSVTGVEKAAGSGSGIVKWAFSAPDAMFDYLAQGQKVTLSYQVQVSDGDGGTDTETVTITVTGTNDRPTFLLGGAAIGIEQSNVTGSNANQTYGGTLGFTDLDRDDVGHTATVSYEGASGTTTGLSVSAIEAAVSATAAKSVNSILGSVQWTFQAPDKVFDYLGRGETVTLSYKVTVNDGEGAGNSTDTTTVTVTIIGTNDRPVIVGGDLTGSAIEAADLTGASTPALADSGTLTFTDVDLTDGHTVSSTAFQGAVWSNGTTPGATLTALGSAFGASVTQATSGGLDGKIGWTFSLADRHADFLAAGETLTVTYRITLRDDSGASNRTTTQDVTVVITGTNDAPVLSSSSGDVTEFANTALSFTANTVTGQMSFTDVDLNDVGHSAVVVSAARSGETDGLSLVSANALRSMLSVTGVEKAAGSGSGIVKWAFSAPDAMFDYLAQGQKVTLSYQVQVSDGDGGTDTETVTITVTGTNDRPTFLLGGAAIGIEQSNVTGSNANQTYGGTLGFTDLDRDDVGHTATVSYEGASGTTTGLSVSAIEAAVTLGAVAKGVNSILGSVQWTFQAPDKVFDYLGRGETVTLSYKVTVNDGEGAGNSTDTTTVTVTIIGTNDRPVIVGGDLTGSAIEAADLTGASTPALADSGTLTFTDVDLTDGHTVSSTAFQGAVWSNGTTPGATLTALGSAFGASVTQATSGGLDGKIGWTFSLADRHADFLAAGETLTVTYRITLRDDSGASNRTTTQDVTVVITGTNDAPVLSSSSGDVTEFANTALSFTANTVTGQMSFTDVDLNDVGHSAVVVSAARSGETDGLSLVSANALRSMLSVTGVEKAAGSGSGIVKWAFSAPDAMFDYLAQGQKVTLSYQVQVSDGDGGTDTETVTITVTGTNDRPTFLLGGAAIGIEQSNVTGSNANQTYGGTLGFTDLDRDDVGHTATVSYEGASGTTTGLSVSAIEAAVTLGAVAKGVNSILGSVQWTFQAPDKVFDYLGRGETVTLSYKVTVNDGEGAGNSTDTTTVTVTIIGTNDRPVIVGGDLTGSAIEAADLTGASTPALADSGTLTFTDVDLTDGHTVSSTAFQGAVWSNGTTPGATLTALGSAFGASVTQATSGGLDGKIGWTFSLADRHADFLAAGETLTVTYRITLRDDSGASNRTTTQDVTVVITGTNDAPVLSSSSGDVTEFANTALSFTANTVTGQMSFTDVDLNDVGHSAVVVSAARSGETDGLSLVSANALRSMLSVTGVEKAAGSGSGIVKWAFSAPDAMFDYLAQGQKVTLSYQVQVSDGDGGTDTETVTITVTGTNDRPTFLLGGAAIGIEQSNVTGSNANQTYGGTLGFTDLDRDDVGHTATVSYEGASGTTTGLSVSAIEAAVSATAAKSVNSILGSVQWTFQAPDKVFDYLGRGETVTLSYKVTVNDGEGAGNSTDTTTVTVTIIGTNDRPVIVGGDLTGSAIEAADLTGASTPALADSGTLTFTDVDLTDGHTVSSTAFQGAVWSNGTTPGATLTALGSAFGASVTQATSGGLDGKIGWTFSLADRHADFLAAGETLTVTYRITLRDDSGASNRTTTQDVTVVITGTNDAPVISIPAGETTTNLGGETAVSRFLSETDAALTSSGVLTVSDVDAGSVVTTQVVGVSGGGAGYNIANALGFLTVAPGSINDAGEVAGNLGWTFNSGSEAFNFLSHGTQIRLTYTIRVTDDRGASDDQLVTILITGTNDAPVISIPAGETTTNLGGETAVSRFLSETDAALTSSGVLTVSDVDAGSVVTTQVVGVSGGGAGYNIANALGFLTVAPGSINDAGEVAGNLGWTFNSGSEAFNFLSHGTQIRLTYTIRVTDDRGASDDQLVTILITGTNDAPVISIPAGETTTNLGGETAVSRFLSETDAALTSSGVLTVSDVDAGSVVTTQVVGVSGGGAGYNIANALGFLTVAPGSINDAGEVAGNLGWTFNSGSEAFNFLSHGTQIRLTYTIRVTDDRGASDDQLVTILITGTNDAPVISIPAGETTTNLGGETAVSRFLSETDAALTSSGVLTVSDVDAGSVVTTQVVGVSGGGAGYNIANALGFLTVAPGSINDAGEVAGNLGWTFNSGSEAFNFLSHGTQIRLTYTIRVTDDRGASDDQLVTILITGTNDAPVITGNISDTVTEDSSADIDILNRLVASGKLTVADPDLGESLFQEQTGVVRTYGTFSIDKDGNWIYYVDNDSPAVQGLAGGASVNDTVTVLTADGTAQLITVTINGANDAPKITSGGQSGSVTELPNNDPAENTLTHSQIGAITFSDVDLSDTHTATPELQSVTWNGTGALTSAQQTALAANFQLAGVDQAGDSVGWTYSVKDDALDFLNAGETATVVYRVTISDGKGGTAYQDVTITINGAADQPPPPLAANRVSPIYAYGDDDTAPAGQPKAISLDLASLFTGQSNTGNVVYTFEPVAAASQENPTQGTLGNGLWGWLTRTGNVISGNPPTNGATGLYTAKVTATDTVTGQTTYTYVAISVLAKGANYYEVTTPGQTLNDLWKGNVIELKAGATIPGAINGGPDDVLIGNETANNLMGAHDRDALYGGGGNDTLDGGSGRDFVAGGDGDDTIYGRSETDILLGEDGNDTLWGGSGDDVLLGGAGDDKLYGESGNDYLDGGDGDDQLWGASDNDILLGGAGNDTLYGDSGNDYLDGGDGDDQLWGGLTTTFSWAALGMTSSMESSERMTSAAERVMTSFGVAMKTTASTAGQATTTSGAASITTF
nr:VCBS domain-containing protein [Roseateles sp. XES5]